MKYANVIVDISQEALDRPFLYRIPPELEETALPGALVKIPFGKGNRIRKGYIIGLSDHSDMDPEKIKTLQEVCTDQETEPSRLIELAVWIRKTYGCTMIQALRTALPLQRKIQVRTPRSLVPTVEAQKLEEAASALHPVKCKGRIRVLKALAREGSLDISLAGETLGLTGSIVRYLEKAGLATVRQEDRMRLPLDWDLAVMAGKESQRPALSPLQTQALMEIRSEWDSKDRPLLLYGVTGSGKTLLYMELIQDMLTQGRQVIVLIPEIALTFQTVRRFRSWFGDSVSFINSQLSEGERYSQFQRARQGEVQIMVGPRSALFTPFENLGLIIMDEEHETTYKSEITPRYHARETAIYRCKLEKAHIVMGSATPSLEAYSRAKRGKYALVTLKGRYSQRPLPPVEIVDMRRELREGNRLPISRRLEQALGDCLSRGEQAMLFLNRRGYAGFVSCRSCGVVFHCPHCDVSLSEHNEGRLVCHYCGYETRRFQTCPQCGSAYVGGFKAGTQQIEKTVRSMFPAARVLRMDFDTTRRKGSYEAILKAFLDHEADVLIGTQMIVKGHDFPDVTLVGAIAADLSLGNADYRCAERTYQLLAQAAGRAGRASRPGMALFQTYQPDHYSIQAAARQDYEAFYQEEIGFRTLLDYPPASHMMGILGSSPQEDRLKTAMDSLAMLIRRMDPEGRVHLIGPAPAAVGKVRDTYHRSLHLKHPQMEILRNIRERLEKYMEANEGFHHIYIQFDMQ